jgi:hypothetical protein
MIYRQDLFEHLEWLEGSEFYDTVIDEALVAIALTAYGHGGDWIQCGAWLSAAHLVERLELSPLVARLRQERIV